jgi:glycine reductase
MHYINQFFAGLGSEERAHEGPRLREGVVGPGRLLQQKLGSSGEVVATVLCGDSYFNEKEGEAIDSVMRYVSTWRPDLVIAGPAFSAGRYGLACGRVCHEAHLRHSVPSITAMHPENPAVEMYRSKVYIVPSAPTVVGMSDALEHMAKLGGKLGRREPIGNPREEGYLPRGLRFTELARETGAARAVDMLVRSLHGEDCETEWPLPSYDRVPPPLPLKDLAGATIALVTSGGIVPRGNPDRIESTYATKWAKYSLAGVNDLTPDKWQSIHGGYDTTRANEDPDRVLPVDVLREFEAQGRIGRLLDEYWVFVGSGASTTNARRFAEQMAKDLIESGVKGVIFTAT